MTAPDLNFAGDVVGYGDVGQCHEFHVLAGLLDSLYGWLQEPDWLFQDRTQRGRFHLQRQRWH